MVPVLLNSSFREKVWGSTRLSPWYPDSTEKIGEVWFEATPPLPLLLKFIFTSEALSVQVHPNDEYAGLHENSRGKTEMWHILRADPGAKIAIGLREEMTAQRLRDAAQSGEIEKLLNWVEVKPGDTFHIPAGTIHAIGAGIVLCEIQQNSDVTYRLYDYGRPRELHLDRGVEVSIRIPWTPDVPPRGLLASCQYYATESLAVSSQFHYQPDPERFHVLIVLEGTGMMGGEAYRLGQAWLVAKQTHSFDIAPSSPTRILRTYVP